MDTLIAIRVFRQVVESGSFVGAADRLNMATATVSRHVMYVEKRLGVRLLNRNNRTLSLTEAGRMYFERCKIFLAGLEETELELGSLTAVPRGTLRVTCPTWFGGQRMAKLLAEYRLRYPEVVVDVSQEDRIVDLVAEGFDVAMRVTRNPRSLPAGVIARRVQSLPFFVGGAHSYLLRRGIPRLPGELSAHDFVATGNRDSLALRGPEGAQEAPVHVVLRFRSLIGVVQAVAAGVGLAALPRSVFEDPGFRATVTPVLTEYPLEAPTLYLIYLARKNAPLKVRTFVDFILESLADAPSRESETRNSRAAHADPVGSRPGSGRVRAEADAAPIRGSIGR